jgi:hypothetical protein
MDPRDEPPTDGRPETLLAATVLLMSAYARDGGGPRLAGAVLRHLELLAQRCDVPGVLAATCDHAADHWVQLARPVPDAAPARPRRRSLPALLRLVAD